MQETRLRQSPYPLLSKDKALQRVLAQVSRLSPTRLPSRWALGRVLAEAILAPLSIPPFPAATVDGYAVLAAAGVAPRRVVGSQLAGYVTTMQVTGNTAVWVTTGAPVPAGADAVAMVEVAEERDGYVLLHQPPRPGDGIRPHASDVEAGQTVLPAGTVLRPAELGLIASLGMTEITAYPPARVAVLSTGDEVIEPGQPLQAGKIYDANRFALMAALTEIGAEPVDWGIATDQQQDLAAKVAQALAETDALITSGAVSMGDLDLLKPLLGTYGQLLVGRVRVKPGKPFTFALVQGKPVFALPGNPVSSLVTFELFVRPAILKMQGHANLTRPRLRVRLTHTIRHDPERLEYQRAVASRRAGEYWATVTGNQVSSRLLSLVGANVLLELPDGQADFALGEQLEALIIGDLGA